MKIWIELLLSAALLMACALAAQTADRVAKLQEQPPAAACAQAPCDAVLVATLATAQNDIARARKTPLKTP